MKNLIIIVLLVMSGSVFGEGFKSENETRIFSDNLLNQLLEEKFQEAFDSVKPYWPMPEVEIDSIVNKINQQWPIVRQRFGEPVGIEFIKQEQIGKSFLRYYYLHKFENHAIYWRLDYYKSHDEWKINMFLFLDSLDVLYE